jgi:hypothetical protein
VCPGREFDVLADGSQERGDKTLDSSVDEVQGNLDDSKIVQPPQEEHVTAAGWFAIVQGRSVPRRVMTVTVHQIQPGVLLSIVVGIRRRAMNVQPWRLDHDGGKGEGNEGAGSPAHVLGSVGRPRTQVNLGRCRQTRRGRAGVNGRDE